jgi:hypothetical protein
MMPRRSASAMAAGNLLVPFSRRQKFQDLPLARRQRRLAGPDLERGQNVGRYHPLARVHRAQNAHQVVGNGVLQQIAHGAGLEVLEDVLLAVVHRQHHDARPRIEVADGADGLETGHDRQLQVHHRHVGPVARELLHGFGAVVGLGHHGHVLLQRDDAGQPLAQQAVIVDNQQANGFRHCQGLTPQEEERLPRPWFRGRGR